MKLVFGLRTVFLGDIPVSSTRVTGARIKLNRGLPYIIPTNFRREIRKSNLSYIHIIGSILESFKGLQGEYKEADLSSILTPPIDIPLESFENFVTEYIKRRPAKDKIEDYGDTPDPIIFSAGPNNPISVSGIYEDASTFVLDPSECQMSSPLLMVGLSNMEESSQWGCYPHGLRLLLVITCW